MKQQRIQPEFDFKILGFCTALHYPSIYLSWEEQKVAIWLYISMWHMHLYAVLRNEDDFSVELGNQLQSFQSHVSYTEPIKQPHSRWRLSSHKSEVTLTFHIFWLISSQDDSDKPRIILYIWLCFYISPTGRFPTPKSHLISTNFFKMQAFCNLQCTRTCHEAIMNIKRITR